MPQLFNGIGTWYLGQRAQHYREGECEACHAYGHLLSYDTMKYFLLVYVPLVPLGKRRVIDECSRCHRHRVVSLRKWNEGRTVTIQEAFEEFRDDPGSLQKLQTVLGTAVAFQCDEAVDVARSVAAPELRENARAFSVIGDAQSYFGQLESAEESYRASIGIEDAPEVREDLAGVLVRLGRPAEAGPFLEHLVEEPDASKAARLCLLIESYAAHGMHSEVLALLERWRPTCPAELSDDVDKYQKTSEKHVTTGKKVASPLVRAIEQPPGVRGPTLMARLAPVIGPAILLVILMSLVVATIQAGRNREIHLVNGTSTRYEVEIGSETVTLPPHGRYLVTLPEGDVLVRTHIPGGNVREETVEVRTSFYTRLFESPVFVINPDRAALLETDETVYSERTEELDSQYASQSLIGELLYRFDGIDYVFRDFPDEIQLSGDSALRERLRLVLIEPEAMVNFLATTDPESALAYLRSAIPFEPNNGTMIGYLAAFLPADEFLREAEGYLDDRPVKLQWHRIYQTQLERAEPDHDLTARYRELLDTDRESGELRYLMGRVCSEPSEAESFFLSSVEADPPCAWGFFALSYARLSSGRFEEALELCDKALALEPGNADSEVKRGVAAYAAGRYQELLAANTRLREDEPLEEQHAVERIDLLVRLGRADEAREVIEGYKRRCEEAGIPRPQGEMLGRYLAGELEYRLGTLEAAADAFAATELSGLVWRADVIRGKLAAASEAMAAKARPPA